MWSQDDFPGAETVPWQLLIRARYAYEIDALIASTIVNGVAAVGSRELAIKVAVAAKDAVRRSQGEGADAADELRLGFLRAAQEWDGPICGNNPPRPHGPRGDWLEEVGDPIVAVVLARGAELVRTAGSPALQKSLGAALQEF